MKIKEFIAENASFQGYFTEVFFEPTMETVCYIFKLDIFSRFFDDFMSHIIG
jgi:hypothetical protein